MDLATRRARRDSKLIADVDLDHSQVRVAQRLDQPMRHDERCLDRCWALDWPVSSVMRSCASSWVRAS